MAITFSNNTFNIFNDNMSYIIKIGPDKSLLHMHYGGFVNAEDIEIPQMPMAGPYKDGFTTRYSMFSLPCEIPTRGTGDFRSPLIEVEFPDGSTSLDFSYISHTIENGKPKLNGLPSTYTEDIKEAETLKIITRDEASGVEAHLYYTIYEGMNVICRHTEIINKSGNDISLMNAGSVSMDFPVGDYEYIHLPGATTREKNIERNTVHKGIQGFSSGRGASGHGENPFMAFMQKGATESTGEVFGVSLIYSGNHRFILEMDSNEDVRIQAGINPQNFRYKLKNLESFVSPEAVLVYSPSGLNFMSQTYHRLYRTRLCRGKYRDTVRPVLINNWEGTYFDFNGEKLLSIAKKASEAGIELFVLDDGWFGKRNDDKSSLGDWIVNEEKLGCTMGEFAQKINSTGLKFGLWFEPEMVNEDSELFKNHPDWIIKSPGRKPLLKRNQYVLDFTRSEIRNYIVDAVSKVLSSANIEYVKWDMNRDITEAYSTSLGNDCQGEFYHRYISGVYDVMERITSAFPDVLFEGCASGGGRNDPGILYYMPQNWLSDNTDALDRLDIQKGASLVYPISSFGCHVSAVPNHQTGRYTSLSMRGTVAMNGAFGYELDITNLSDKEICEIKSQVKFYKKIRDIVNFGNMYRLDEVGLSDSMAWMYVTEDLERALLYYVVKKVETNHGIRKIKLKGLKPEYRYEINGKQYSGYTLMNYGYVHDVREEENENFVMEINRLK